MRSHRAARNGLIIAAVLCVLGYASYQLLLDDRAKEGVSSLTRTVRNSYTQMNAIASRRRGIVLDEDTAAQNRQHLRKTWKQLGF